MTPRVLPNRIRELRQAAGLSQAQLAERANTSAPQIDRLEKGGRRLTLDWMLKISSALGCAPEELIGAVSARQIPLVGTVGAGERVIAVDDHLLGGGLERVDAPTDLADQAVAVRVRGASMFPAYWDGDVLIYAREADFIRDACLYNECVVRVRGGETFVKRVMPGRSPGRYDLASYNAPPMTDVEIEWASPVLFHDKRSRRSKVVDAKG